MARLGTISLQSMDECDGFLREDVYLDGVKESAELQTEIPEPAFDQEKAWVSGDVPGVIPVAVDGDTSVIYGWFKGEDFSFPFAIRIYLEYEEVEEIEEDAP